MRVGLVGCCEKKLPYPAPARELYQSQLFKAALRYATAYYHKVYVLSALYGLVELDEVIEPYNLRLTAHPCPERVSFDWLVKEQMLEKVPSGTDVFIHAGVHYRWWAENPWVADTLPWRIHVPFKHTGIGGQLAFYAHMRRYPEQRDLVAEYSGSA